NQDAGAENGAEDLVEFEGVHGGSGPKPEGLVRPGDGPRDKEIASGIRLSRRTLSRVQISVCPASGNPVKRADFRPFPTISGPVLDRLPTSFPKPENRVLVLI